MTPKRPRDLLKDVLEFLLEDWDTNVVATLKTLEPDQAAVLVTYIAQQAGIMDRQIKKSRLALLSFSSSKWAEVAPHFGLSGAVEHLQLEPFSSPSFDLPEPAMVPTTYSPGGVVEHKDILIANITWEHFCSNMIPAANKIFSVLMHGYLESVEATVTLCQARDQSEDSSDNGSLPSHQMIDKPSILASTSVISQCMGASSRIHPSLAALENGLALAKQAYEELQKCTLVGATDQFKKSPTDTLDLLSRR
ncbi:unnamed protein product [Cyclocybe aegerita]|uniref:Uncharacterized protein n=1 Tax=Cyclocybe aegerita TaxID=1973307 RepID=A0A8S0VS16_CYCAE|nr:unnamed protein product [Cyclocybe aegerita]